VGASELEFTGRFSDLLLIGGIRSMFQLVGKLMSARLEELTERKVGISVD
jgi:hypothetical protein